MPLLDSALPAGIAPILSWLPVEVLLETDGSGLGSLAGMRPLRYSINVTLDGCCDHREVIADEDLHRHPVENIAGADALLFGRVTYQMMEEAWRP